ncbi:MAG: Gfo/Idh/MocA family oxidoreductase [Phycisphaerales bacterium]|nr:Gfo/Idh/MocA family oxidoreductase [Planctomycetota bacterium]
MAKKSQPPARKIRYAVVGLGHIAQAAVLPAFAHAGNSELVALVTGDAKKLNELGKRYKVSALYGYEDLARCIERERIDAVYVATPNSEHLPIVERAAGAGAHVLCEKPLAVTARECRAMIHACDQAGVLLMTAYRLHFDPANLKALEVARSGKIGEPRHFISSFSYQIKDQSNIRLQAELGGGPLHDIGIYCVNAARSLFQADPIEVQAWTAASGDKRFAEVEETVTAMLRFPEGRLATFMCSFGLATTSWFELLGTKGAVCLDAAYEYTDPTEVTVTVNEKARTSTIAKRDQFASELVYFSDCVRKGQQPEPSGREGLADVRVIHALLQSIARNRPLRLAPARAVRHPSPRQEIRRAPVRREPRLIHARSASQ